MSIQDTDNISALHELTIIGQQLARLNENSYEISMRKKMLRHREADLKYSLSSREKELNAV